MKILIYTSHPAQFLFFRNSISFLENKGHSIRLLIKSKDVLEDLVKASGKEYTNILSRERRNNAVSIILALLKRNIRILGICLKDRPDLIAGTDPSLAQVGWLLRIPVITTLEDDIEVIPGIAKLAYPFTSYIFAPELCSVGKYEHKKIPYNGLMKLAYLHPGIFKPDEQIIKSYIDDEPYCLIRLSALQAHHDIKESGISDAFLEELISKLSQKMKVWISSEKILPEKYEPYRISINPSHIHHLLYFARILVSDSQSMSVEASILGTPSIRISSFTGRIRVLEELENKYQLSFGVSPDDPEKVIRLLDLILSPKKNLEYKVKAQKLINEKAEVSSLLSWLLESFPVSAVELQKNPLLQYNFQNK